MTADTEALTPRQAAGMARELYTIRQTMADMRRAEEVLAKALREYLRETGEPIEQEGVPTLLLKDVPTPRSWDVMSMPDDMVRFLQQRAALTCNGKIIDALAEIGLLPADFHHYEMRGSTDRLEFERRPS